MTSTNAQPADRSVNVVIQGSPPSDRQTPHGSSGPGPRRVEADDTIEMSGLMKKPGTTSTTDSAIGMPGGVGEMPHTIETPETKSGNIETPAAESGTIEMTKADPDVREQNGTTVSASGRAPNSKGSNIDPSGRAQTVFNNTILAINSAYVVTRSPLVTALVAVITVLVSIGTTRKR